MRHRRPGPDESSSRWIRPYVATQGRTHPRERRQLPVEALVTTTERGQQLTASLVGDYQAICRQCVTARSVAEIAAARDLPLQVTRVLVADLVDIGLVRVEVPSLGPHDRPSLRLLQRVLNGLRRL